MSEQAITHRWSINERQALTSGKRSLNPRSGSKPQPSEGYEFDPNLGSEKYFSDIRARQVLIDHINYLPAPTLTTYYLTTYNTTAQFYLR